MRKKDALEDYLDGHEPIAGDASIATGTVLSGWRIVAFLGRGGNAEVYRVVHLSLPLQGALKILMRNEPTHVERFKRETVLFGPGYIEDELCGLLFRISPASFYQVNPAQTQTLYETAIDFAGLTGRERVLDAYCGTGTIGLAAAGRAAAVAGVERSRDAVRDAIANAKRNGIKNAYFTCADAGDFMVEAAAQGEECDVVFMDPPRAGASSAFLTALLTLAPARVVYVSCDPETLARDLGVLTAGGYRAQRIQPVDMFPHTAHIETVVKLARAGS